MYAIALLAALATSAAAVPFAGDHGHKHARFHSAHTGGWVVPTGTGAPYPTTNATGFFGASTGSPVSADYSPVVAATDVAADSATTCTNQSTVYVTSTNRVTVTLTSSYAEVSPVSGSGSASSTALASTVSESVSSTSLASTMSGSGSSTASVTSSLDLQNKAYGGGQGKSSSADAVSTSTSTSASVTPIASVVADVAVDAYSTTSSSAAASSSSSSSSGKRGVAYNDATLASIFESSSEVTWGYNWGQSSSGLSSSFKYVPMLWGTSSTFTSDWSAAASSAISSGSTHLMGFNEPDLSTQSDLTPAAAATAWKTYMEPFAGQAKLGAPAVTNGAGSMGLDWLAAFLEECSDCTIDFVSIHWYDSASNTAYFQEHVANATSVAGNLPVWVTEFGCTSGTDDEISSFLETVMPWMDSQSYVEAYSYFMVSDGLLISGDSLTSYGSTYASYTS